jgi:sporulation protein YlmC with PRC-barrel domain
VIVVGVTGERIGTVERLEIDKTGRLKALVVQIASAFGSRKRIHAESIRAINDGVVEVEIAPSDVSSLVDERDPHPADLWMDEDLAPATA